MFRATWFVCLGSLAFLAAGCASDDEALAEKDRLIQEKSSENEGLARQNSDLKSTSVVMQRELDEKNRQLAIAQAQAQPTNAPALGSVHTEPKTSKDATPVASHEKGESNKGRAAKVSIKDEDVDVIARGDGATLIRMSGGAGFDAGSATLTKRGKDALKKIADELKDTTGEIRIEGHTDATPLTGKNKERFGTNQHLSIARALAVQEYLVTNCKFPKSRIGEVVGLGETKPLDKANTKAAHAKNRRVDIILHSN